MLGAIETIKAFLSAKFGNITASKQKNIERIDSGTLAKCGSSRCQFVGNWWS
jgi:hypothetical protein